MEATIISPYAGNGSIDDPFRPLVFDEFAMDRATDVTGRENSIGLPTPNLYLVRCMLSGAQLSQIKSDNRFFVLEPGPGYNGSALQTWLNDKGATDNPVTGNETAEEATSKLRGYFKEL